MATAKKHTIQIQGNTHTFLMHEGSQYGVTATGEQRIWTDHLASQPHFLRYDPSTRKLFGGENHSSNSAFREALADARQKLGAADEKITKLEQEGFELRERVAELVSAQQRMDMYLQVHLNKSFNQVLDEVNEDGVVPSERDGETSPEDSIDSRADLYSMAVKSLEVEVGKMTKPRGILSMIKTKFPSFQALKLANADDLQSIKGIGAATAKRMVSALDDILNVPVVFDEENFISNADEQTLDVDPNGLSTLEMQQLLNSENVNV